MSVVSFLGYDDGTADPGTAIHTHPSHSSLQDLGPGAARQDHPLPSSPWLASEELVSTAVAYCFLRATLQVFHPLCTYTCIPKAAWSLGEQNACPNLSSCYPAGE